MPDSNFQRRCEDTCHSCNHGRGRPHRKARFKSAALAHRIYRDLRQCERPKKRTVLIKSAKKKVTMLAPGELSLAGSKRAEPEGECDVDFWSLDLRSVVVLT